MVNAKPCFALSMVRRVDLGPALAAVTACRPSLALLSGSGPRRHSVTSRAPGLAAR